MPLTICVCRCGPWFGKICCCILAVDMLLLHLLAWLRPATDIDVVPDYIPASKALRQPGNIRAESIQQKCDAAVQTRVSSKTEQWRL